MERPNKLYPTPPKPEWFMNAANNMQHNQSTGPDAGSYTKMDSAKYTAYLRAHNDWVALVRQLDVEEHNAALKRRLLSGYTEKAEFKYNGQPVPPPPRETVVSDRAAGKLVISYSSTKKKEHTPEVSVKPHRAEKRAEKKKLAAERTKVAVELIKAKTATLAANTDNKASVVWSVESLRQQQPLRRAELEAAKIAVQQVKAITLGSSDLVANVSPGEGWKVVTRRKGEATPLLSKVTEIKSPNGITSWEVRKDPVVSNNLVPKTAVRRPETQVAKA